MGTRENTKEEKSKKMVRNMGRWMDEKDCSSLCTDR
jgi:hypothetical protein